MKLFVAIPSSGSVPTRFMHCVSQLGFAVKEGITIENFFGAGVINARIVAANRFLETDCTHLLTIDSDIVNWTPDVIQQLIKHDKDVIGAFYTKKQMKLDYVCAAFPEKEEAGPDGLMELARIGTGFLLVKREVFLKMKEKFKDVSTFINVQGKELFDFYPMGVIKREYVSEDWGFCDRARICGYKIYGDTNIVLGHLGEAIYPIEDGS